ncbi:MAG: DUF503 domain-containing protein [Desulforegulaceae bacterium]|jgi:hypothetical protein|nr:DUF503 domain-containing protein [Desulfobacteraceae bacterium]MCB9495125.1 DUF503 domain-containing protein [Desulfobacteraceae bacterium]MDY0360200.1 DUF503 domain-containing protein [Desulforegulaceae bacterium]
MYIASGILKYKIHECFSLKQKRSHVKPIISKIQNEFNASVCEAGSLDKYQIAEIGFSMVSNDKNVLNSKVDKLFNLAESSALAELIDSEYDIYSF